MPHDPLAVARSYVAEHGERLGIPALDEAASTLVPDPARSKATAALYEKLRHSPNNPKVRRAYDALIAETKAQFEHAQKHGVHFEKWRDRGQPYTDSDHMRADVRENAHLFYFPTDAGFGEEPNKDHPLFQVDPETGLRYNDMFRAVHDYFAHAVHPHQFGPKGEMRAWHEHAKMFSPLARLAMTAETHGQNSWVNFGPHSHKPVLERPYAEQKATLMPTTQWPKKLARVVDTRKWKYNPNEEADRAALTDHMDEEGDPRKMLIQEPPGVISAPAGYDDHVHHPRFDRFVPRTVGLGGRNSWVKKAHVFPDGTELRVSNFHHGGGELPDLVKVGLHTHIKGDTSGAIHQKLMTHDEFDAWLDSFPEPERTKIVSTFADPNGPRPKAKLARPTGVFGRLKSVFGGAPQPNRTEYDGIVHVGHKNGKLDADGYAKVVAEKSAVAAALQRLGAFSQRSDPAKHREKVNLFTDVAHFLHRQDFPGLRPILDHYRKAANNLNAPDVVNPQPDKPKPGEWPEPANRTHYTVPNVGPAGMELTDAAVPLVRAVDRILAKTKPGHVPLDAATAPPESTLADEKNARAASTDREPKPEVPPPQIKPGHGDKFTIGLADMRKFRKEQREERAKTPNEMDFDPDAVPEADRIPLVNYPGEIGPTGDRYFDINKLLVNGAKKDDVLKHLRDKYALSPRNARAALARFLRHKSNIGRVFKLARLRALLKVRLGRLVDASKWKVNLKDGTDRGALADHMAEEGDPREFLLRRSTNVHTDYYPRFVYRPHPRFQERVKDVFGRDAGFTEKKHTFPDASWISATWYTEEKRNPQQHLVVRFRPDSGTAYEDAHTAKMTVPEFDDWIDSFPDDERAKLRTTFGEREDGKKRGKQKLARVQKKDFTTGAESHIAGSRFAYHLAQIAKEYAGTLLGKAAKYALTLKARDRLGEQAGTTIEGLDIYDRIGKLLNREAMPVANDVHKKQEALLRKYQPTGTVHEAFDKLTRAQKKELGELGGTQTTPEKEAEAFRARAVARHFRDAYNWNKVDAGLALDRHVANFLKTHVQNQKDEDTLYTAAHRSFDIDRGAARGKDPALHGRFWDAVRKYVNDKTGAVVHVSKINESLARLADRAYERREIGADAQPTAARDPRPVKADPKGPTTHGWRDSFGWLPGARHAKFALRNMGSFVPALRTERGAHQSLKSFDDSPIHDVLADFLRDEDDPRLRVVEDARFRNKPGAARDEALRLSNKPATTKTRASHVPLPDGTRAVVTHVPGGTHHAVSIEYGAGPTTAYHTVMHTNELRGWLSALGGK